MTFVNFKEIVRWCRRNKATTILSISGMAIGMTIALLIGFWSLNEFSFDRFHVNGDRMYRVCRQGYINNESTILGSDFGPVGTTSKDQFPEIEAMCRLVREGRQPLKINGGCVYEDHIGAVDPDFFRFFSFKLQTGDPETCLDKGDKMIIDRSLANRYFPNENPVGQCIEVYGKRFLVSGVMENMPENSHLKYSILVPVSALPWLSDSKWGNNDNFLTYLRLKKGTNTALLAKKITAMTYKNFPEYERFKITHFLQPLYDIHFSPGFRFDFVITNDRRIVVIFISLAALILLIASFNFINLFISTSFLRGKSIGVKKINGSSKTRLFLFSYSETALYILVATVLAFAMVWLTIPFFNQLTGSHLQIDFGKPQVYMYTFVLLVLTVLVAGTIPVLYILRFNPEGIIRNRFKGGGVTALQRVLVVSQFVASIVLISSAGVIKKQIDYVKNKDLGFDRCHILYIFPNNLARNYNLLRDQLLKNPDVLDVTAKSCLPYEWNNGNNVSLPDHPEKDQIMEVCRMKHNYAGLMKIPLVEGRNPFTAGDNKTDECLINEQAAIKLGLTDPVGKQIRRGDEIFTIAGVLKNANTKSLHLQVDPQVYLPMDIVEGYYPVLIKTTGRPERVVRTLAELWNKSNPGIPFEYHFLNDDYDRLYKTEETASKIVSIGMVVALFLAFMGLYAISHYATERRIKEIGIRKVNGARVFEVLVMLNRDFVRWILVAIAIAIPAAWYILHKWLENFAYKTSLSWWIFVLPGLLALAIAFVTVSWQSWKTATRNPVDALRYE